MRKDKELLQLVIDSLRKGGRGFGICAEISNLFLGDFINTKEFDRLYFLIKTNKPTKTNRFKEFTQNEYWIDDDFWWYTMSYFKPTIEIRIDYLEKLQTIV